MQLLKGTRKGTVMVNTDRASINIPTIRKAIFKSKSIRTLLSVNGVNKPTIASVTPIIANMPSKRSGPKIINSIAPESIAVLINSLKPLLNHIPYK